MRADVGYSVRVRALALLPALCLAACSAQNPLPPERADYAGTWSNERVSLTITPQGQVRYDRKEGEGQAHVEGPIAGWKGDGFVVGVMTVKTSFEVTEPPHEVGGAWTMTVNGDTLMRTPAAP